MPSLFTRKSMPGGAGGRLALSLTLAAVVGAAVTAGTLVPVPQASAQGKLQAPELTGGTAWLGTDRPLTLKDLRGRIVILEFWTLC